MTFASVPENTLMDEMEPDLRRLFERAHRAIERRRRLSQPIYEALSWAAAQIGYHPPTGGPLIIVNIGCGAGEDMQALNSFFGGRENGQVKSDVLVIGIDRSAEALKDARALNAELKHNFTETNFRLQSTPPAHMAFIQADATELHLHAEIPSGVDAVVIRHPMVLSTEQPWARIIHNALDRLSPDGVAFMTTYSMEGHRNAEAPALRKLVENHNYELLLHEPNPHATPDKEYGGIIINHTVTAVRKAAGYRTPPAPPLPMGYEAGTTESRHTGFTFGWKITELKTLEQEV
jgi:SAM-dependent methyltransferase